MPESWIVVTLLLLVAVAALVLVLVGVGRSIRASGAFDGRPFRRPAAPWTLTGVALVVVDAVALVAWLLSMPA